MNVKIKREKQQRRYKRVRAKIIGISKRPRLCVFRSAKHIYVQLVRDEEGKTIIAVNDKEIKEKKVKIDKIDDTSSHLHSSLSSKVRVAKEVGKLIAEKALKKKIKEVVFDRGGYKYHGRVKAIAEGAREGGLQF